MILANNLVPVTHGDVVFDEELGCSVASSDTIVQHLSNIFRPSHVVFVTDVDGIYDKDPNEANAILINHILLNPFGKITCIIQHEKDEQQETILKSTNQK